MEQINHEKRKKILIIGKTIAGITAGLIASKVAFADIFLGQQQKQPVHIWQEALYNGSVTRDTNDDIQTVTLVKPKGNQVTTVTRTGGDITSYAKVYDGVTQTVTISRDGDGDITGWTIS